MCLWYDKLWGPSQRVSYLVLSSQLTLTYQALLVRYDKQNIIILLEVEPIKSGYV